MTEDGAIENVSAAARGLLAACAVLGESFTFSQLFSIIGDPHEHGTARFLFLRGWAELRGGALIASDDPNRPDALRFSRVGLRDQILGRLSESERDRLEARIAASALGRGCGG